MGASPPADNGTRAVAVRIVRKWLATEQFPDRLIADVQPGRAFVVELVYGVVRRRRTLEWILAECSDRKPEAAALPALLCGAYQLCFMGGVADHAAVHETVAAVKTGDRRGLTGYVNAVLRRIARERDSLATRLHEQSPGIRWSHPDVLVQRWTERYGARATEALCAWNNTPAEVVGRARPAAGTTRDFLRAARDAGIDARPHPFAPDDFVVLPRGCRVPDLPGYARGAFTVQDPSTAMAVDLMDLQPGHDILDACAAPGGKAVLVSDRLGGRCRLVCADLHADRLDVLKRNLVRLRIDGVTVIRADLAARRLPRDLADASFDRILLDAPCTNTGVLRRRPDARWRFSEKRLARLALTQHALLDGTAALLRPGGRLVYSTCSLAPEENEDLVAAWLQGHPAFTLADSRSLFPPDTGTDGIYTAALVRR